MQSNKTIYARILFILLSLKANTYITGERSGSGLAAGGYFRINTPEATAVDRKHIRHPCTEIYVFAS
jgi:hypothetical protein